MKIAHIINPVKVTEKSDLFIAQPVTFETMRKAQQFADINNDLEVELYFTCYKEDLEIKPNGFKQTKLLEKSILDYKNFDKKRKLPLIKDILDRLYESSDADYFIYTNVDIALEENFYTEVKNMIDKGYDGLVINRRTIDKKYTSINEISQMYADPGKKHPGYDCFVFKRDVYPNYQLGTACIGANWIGRVLISNVIAYSSQFKVFEDEHLTFHIGDDRSWKISEFNAYDKNNENTLIELLENLMEDIHMYSKTYLKKFYYEHIKVDPNEKFNKKLIEYHTTKHMNLPASANIIYGNEYKPSNKWEKPITLRQDPIFVVGYPRSGTTLLQSLLSTQQNIISLPEVHFFFIIRQKLKVINDRIQKECIDDVLKVIRERINFSIEAQNHIEKLSNEGKLSPKMLYEIIIVDNLIDKEDFHSIKTDRWLEKTPDNGLFLEIIFRFYPNAKVINIIRNPEKAILSRRKYFDGESSWPVEIHIEKWKNSIKEADSFSVKYPKKIMSIRLEDLVDNQIEIMGKVCDFIDIKLDIRLLKNYRKIANKYYMPWEIWKQDTSKNISKNISDKSIEFLNNRDRIKLLELAKTELDEYNYIGNIKQYMDKKEILVYSQVPTHPQRHGNSKRIYNYSKYLKSLGYNIHFVYFNMHPDLECDIELMKKEWSSMHIIDKTKHFNKSRENTFLIDDIYQNGLGEQVAQICKELSIDTIILNYIFQSKILEYLPDNILKIIDTHDKFTDRHILLQENGIDSNSWWYYYTKEEEAKGLNRADIIFAIQKREADFFAEITNTNVKTITHLEEKKFINKDYSDLKKIGFIGSDNVVNQKAINSFIIQFDNYAKSKKINFKLYIGGLVCKKLNIKSEFIEKVGEIDNLESFYSKMDLIINPLMFGTGLKIKTVEALSYGIPIISTVIGFEGVESKYPYHQCTNIREMINYIDKLNKKEEKLIEMSNSSRKIFEQYDNSVKNIIQTIFPFIGNGNTEKENVTILNNDSLMERFKELCSYSILTQPLQKYKAYKKLLNVYHSIKNN